MTRGPYQSVNLDYGLDWVFVHQPGIPQLSSCPPGPLRLRQRLRRDDAGAAEAAHRPPLHQRHRRRGGEKNVTM